MKDFSTMKRSEINLFLSWLHHKEIPFRVHALPAGLFQVKYKSKWHTIHTDPDDLCSLVLPKAVEGMIRKFYKELDNNSFPSPKARLKFSRA